MYSTLSPITLRPLSNANHFWADMQRLLAFAGLGAAFLVGYERQRVLAVLGLVLVAIGLEGVQALTPDRHARVEDGIVKVVAVLYGYLLALIGERIVIRR